MGPRKYSLIGRHLIGKGSLIGNLIDKLIGNVIGKFNW